VPLARRVTYYIIDVWRMAQKVYLAVLHHPYQLGGYINSFLNRFGSWFGDLGFLQTCLNLMFFRALSLDKKIYSLPLK
jgi:hypothetical protein